MPTINSNERRLIKPLAEPLLIRDIRSLNCAYTYFKAITARPGEQSRMLTLRIMSHNDSARV